MRMKKKNIIKGATIKRPQRLQLAKEWIGTYTGKNIVRGYARHYHTDLLCAIKELGLLGVAVSEEYTEAIKRSVSDRALQRQKNREAAEDQDDYQDEYLCFIVGYTSGGAAYGLSRGDFLSLEPHQKEDSQTSE